LVGSRGQPSGIDPNRQWDFLFTAATDPGYKTAIKFWEKEVKNVASYSSYQISLSRISSNGPVLDNAPHKHDPTHKYNSGPGIHSLNNQNYPSRQSPYLDLDPNPPRHLTICRDFDEGRDGREDRSFCPKGRLHVLKFWPTTFAVHARKQRRPYNLQIRQRR
jgi:hypothetical protein